MNIRFSLDSYERWECTNISHSRFTGVVPNKTRSRSRSSDGGNIDDRTAISLINEIRDEVSCGMEDALNVYGEDFVEFVFGDFGCWLGGMLAVFISAGLRERVTLFL